MWCIKLKRYLIVVLWVCFLISSVTGVLNPNIVNAEVIQNTFIIDNNFNGTVDGIEVTTAGFSSSGMANSGVAGYAGTTLSTNLNTTYAQWTPNSIDHGFAVGTYKISFYVPKRPDAWGKAAVNVYHNGTTEIPVQINYSNYKDAGGWFEVGIYNFNGTGDEYVKCVKDSSSGSGTYINVDSVKFERIPSRINTFIIDNDFNGIKEGYTVTTAGFSFSGMANSGVAGYAGTTVYTNSNNAYAQWTPDGNDPGFGMGTYKISYYVPKRPDAWGKAAVSVCHDGRTESPIQIDYANYVDAGGWFEIGTYDFAGSGDGSEYVRCVRDWSALSGTYINIDSVKFERLPSRINTLSGMTINGCEIDGFNAGQSKYLYPVPYDTASITVCPTATDPNTIITVNGVQVTSGTQSNPLSLDHGNNTISICVTPEDVAYQKTYSINVLRAKGTDTDSTLGELKLGTTDISISDFMLTSQSENIDVYEYSYNIANGIGSITVTPTATHMDAIISVNNVPVNSGSESEAIALSRADNIVSIIVTAQNMIKKTTYNIRVHRQNANADLSGLIAGSTTLTSSTLNAANQPIFDASVTKYVYSVRNDTTSITVIPTASDLNAEIYVNDIIVDSGSVSQSINLSSGINEITVLVKAEDRSVTKTYTIYVGRGDLAYGKNVIASNAYCEDPDINSVDGNDNTKWRNYSYDITTNIWLMVDYGKEYTFNNALLKFVNNSNIGSFRIQYSNDKLNWQDAYVYNSTPDSVEMVQFNEVTSRYVRFYAEKSYAHTARPWIGLFTFSVFGSEMPSSVISDSYEFPANITLSTKELGFKAYKESYTIGIDTDTTITVDKAADNQMVKIDGIETTTKAIVKSELDSGAKRVNIEITSSNGGNKAVYTICFESSPFVPGSEYTLTYEDNFDGNSLNENEWFYRIGASASINTKDNVSVSDGMLQIALTKGMDGKHYSGGVISKKRFGYGYYETRAKLWDNRKWHSSFWLNGLSNKITVMDGQQIVYPKYDLSINEIDEFEVDSDQPGRISQGAIYWWPLDTSYGSTINYYNGIDTSDGYHTYGFEWTPTQIKYYIDGILTLVSDYSGPHQAGIGVTGYTETVVNSADRVMEVTAGDSITEGRGSNIWLTAIAVENNFDDASLPGNISFDYFRYYEKDYNLEAPEDAIIVDNADPGYTDNGSWVTVNEAFGYQDLITRYSNTPGDWAQWTPDIPETGNYEAFIWNPSFYNNTSNAKYTVTYEGGTKDVIVDQKYGGQQWISLGMYKFTSGIQGNIRLTATENANIRTDAVMFVPVLDIHVTGITLDKTSINMNSGATEMLAAAVTPENATNKTVTWSSSDPTIAVVDENSNVTGLTEGTTSISVTTVDGLKMATCIVNVDNTPPATTVSIDGTVTSGWFSSDAIVTLSTIDNLSGTDKMEYKIGDSGDWLAYTAPFTLEQEGKFIVQYRSTDKAGNVEDIKQQTVRIDKAPFDTLVVFKDSNGNPVNNGVVTYYDGLWKNFGTTDPEGFICKYLPNGNYLFRMTYEGSIQDKRQDIGTNPVVDYRTVNATVQFKNSQDNIMNAGDVTFYTDRWHSLGTINGGTASKELLPGSYIFRMTYEGSIQDKRQDIGTNPVVDYRTVNATVQFKNSQDNIMNAGDVTFYTDRWHSLGTINGGTASKELLPGSYIFRMTYEGSIQDKRQDIGTDPVVDYRTINATVQFKDSQDNIMNAGDVTFYTDRWRSLGTINGGTASKELLTGSYIFRMTYEGSIQDKRQDIGTNPVVDFRTVKVTVKLEDSSGNLIDTGTVSFYTDRWRTFGSTTGGTVDRELLIGRYPIRMEFQGVIKDLQPTIIADQDVIFQYRL